MKNENLVPKVRFKGFSDPWEQRKLGELFNERKEKSSQGELLSVTINSGIVKFDTLDRKNNSSADKSNYRVVRYGDIAYNSMRMWQGASGLSMYNGIVSPAYTVITPRTNTDAGFMAVNFKRKSMIQVFQRNSQGLTSDTWNLKFPVLKNIRISIPKITEQQIITELFTVINNLIAANEDKLEQLKTLKKLMMQKIFSQEWRFKGFTDPWEQRKLQQIAKVFDGTHQTPEYVSNGVPFVSVENIKTLKTNKYISNNAFQNNFKIFPQKGDIFMTRIGNIGSVNIVENNKDLAYYVSLALIRPEHIRTQYLAQYISSQNGQRQLWRRTLHVAFPKKINKNEISKINIFYPDNVEQEKIGSLIIKSDHLIAANEDKLNQLKELKKYLMQNMFV